MHLINGQPYFDLSPHIDLTGIENIELDIALGLTKSRFEFIDTSARNENIHDNTLPSLFDVIHNNGGMKNPDGPYYKYFKELQFDVRACSFFATIAGKYHQIQKILYLRRLKTSFNIQAKFLSDQCEDTAWYDNFPSLRKWVNNLKIFDQVGRVIFWVNAPGEFGRVHKDAYVGWPDNFLHINLHPDRKEMFLLDDSSNKIIVDTKASVFDIRNWHGTQGGEVASWTFRIDGVFNKEWAESVGVWEHFKNNL